MHTLNKGMKKTRTPRRIDWLDRQGNAIPYVLHPGRFLAGVTGWQYNSTAYSTMPGPEPDVVNIAFLSRRPIEIDHLEYGYHARPKITEPYWINFGYHSEPLSVVRANWTADWVAYWIKPTHRQPRIWREPTPTTHLFAHEIPSGQRWLVAEQFTEDA